MSLVEELDEINEIIFVMKGTVVVGYEINKQKRYCIKYENKCEVGAFGMTFNQRSTVIYTCLTPVSGYSIRRLSWLKLINAHAEIGSAMRRRILWNYVTQIKLKVHVRKSKAI